MRPYRGSRHGFAKLDDWVKRGQALRAECGTLAVTVDTEGVWLHDARGLEYAYVDGPQAMLGLKSGEEWEQAEIALMTSALPAGGVFIDVGANIGRITMEIATTVDHSRVLAIEPVQSTYAALAANITRNGLTWRVTTLRLALGARAGHGAITADLGSGNHLVVGSPALGQEPIDIATLDGLLEQEDLDRVDVIKCDVEGAELPVLEGATRTLEAFHPALLLEVEERWTTRYGRNATELFDFLLALGYKYKRIRAGAVEPPGSSTVEDLSVANNFWFTVD
jgi:FkbM family methyltransferase